MNIRDHVRIYPLMIMVAMMAFSIRLIDFASGVSSLSGTAQAAKGVEEAPEDVKQPDPGALAQAGTPPKPDMDEAEKIDAEKEKSSEGETKAEATAEKTAEEKQAEDKAGNKKAMSAKSSKDGPSVDWRDASDEDAEGGEDQKGVIADLGKRRDSLDKRENELKTREALLKVTEQELDRKYQELSQLRKEIENLLDKQSEEEKARIGSLVKIYEGMKPAEAARIFDTLDLDVLISVLSRMSERKLSPILAAMNPERAKTVTIMLAEEKKLPALPESN